MRRRIGLTMVAAISAASLLAASNASAATQVGDNCLAENALGSVTQLQLATATGPFPLTAPSAGVITQWGVNSKVAAEFQQQLRVFHGSGKVFQTVAESSFSGVTQGANTFATRIPILAGDRIGVYAGPGSATLYCNSGNPGDLMGYVPTNATVGTTSEYIEVAGLKSAVFATVEADADNDGFGDETQDKCPRSAALQAVACPVITLGGLSKLKKGSAQIFVSASSQASVTVFGTVKVPKKSKKGKARQITLQGGTQSVAPGSVVPFSLVYPPSLVSALAALPPSKSLPLAVTMTTTDLAGQPSSTSLTVKLKGQKKGKAKAKGKSKAKGKKA